jgi:hypothetical protein
MPTVRQPINNNKATVVASSRVNWTIPARAASGMAAVLTGVSSKVRPLLSSIGRLFSLAASAAGDCVRNRATMLTHAVGESRVEPSLNGFR